MKAALGPAVRVWIFLALVSALQAAVLLNRARIGDGDLPTQALAFSCMALLLLVNALAYLGLHRLAPTWPVARKLFLGSAPPTLLAVVLAYYYRVFNQHLDLEGLQLAVEGIAHGEAGFDAAMTGKVLGGLALVLALVWLLARASWLRAAASPRPPAALPIAAIALALNGAALGWRAAAGTSDAAYDAQAFIPWVEFLPARPASLALRLEPPIHRDAQHEMALVRSLVDLKPRLLGGEIRAARRPNLLFVHLESLRWDLFNADNMPRLSARARDTLQSLPLHFSTGANTGTGMNGLINGLGGPHYQAVRHYWLRPITLAILERLGYRTSVYATRDMDYEALGDLYFAETLDRFRQVDDGDAAAREAAMTRRYIADLERADDTPRFDYLIYYATHYDYFFPASHAKYLPVQKLGFDIKSGSNEAMRSMRDGLFNRYRNGAYYVDDLVNRIVVHLRDSGRLANTVVVITADHGEEFWEHGAFGHTYGLVNEQIRVPALVHFPAPLAPRYAVTSHADFMPTILDFMQLELGAGDCEFMAGRSLYRYDPGLDHVIATPGIKRKNRSFAEMLVGEGYKIRYAFRDELEVRAVADLADRPLRQFDRARVERLVRRAVARKRELRGGCADAARLADAAGRRPGAPHAAQRGRATSPRR